MHDWRSLVREHLEPLHLTGPEEAGLAEELAQHLEDRYAELTRAGASDAEAYDETVAELDDVRPLRLAMERQQRMPHPDPLPAGASPPGSFVSGVWKDCRYALRSMRKTPIFLLFVTLTLALGIGANTTVFTLINTLILNPLPVRNAGELAALVALDARKGSNSGAFFPVSYPDLEDYQSRNEVFVSLAGFSSALGMTLQERGVAQGMFGEFVTANYFSTLGLLPARGRFFAPEENSASGAHPVAVLNYATWRKRFGAVENIIGQEIRVNDVVLTVIGVAPPHFIGVNAIFGPDVWIPAAMADRLFPNTMQNTLTDRGKAAFLGVGRLRPRVRAGEARANIGTIASRLARTYPATDESHTATVRPIREILLSSSNSSANPVLFGSVALFLVVGIVLLIACSNVANLLLARSAARHQEIAVRLAMGASRRRLIRQLLTESVLLAFLGGAAGLALAYLGLHFLFGRLPDGANFPTPKLDVTVFTFVLLISLATGFLFGTIPAWKASRANLAEALKESGRTAGRTPGRVTLASALLVGQVAFSFLLLVTAALFLHSIGAAYGLDPGFQTAHLAVFPTNPGQAGYTKARTRDFYDDVRMRASGVAGVESVSWASNMPLWARTVDGLEVEGRLQRSRADHVRAVINTVDRNYFETSGVALERGREFTDADQETSLPVAIVNERFAADYWPNGALGKRIQLPGETVKRQVVGVARTANYTSWGEAPQLCAYVPLRQKQADSMVLYVRSKGDPSQILRPVEREIRAAGHRF